MGLFSKIRGGLYKTAKVLGDISAIKNGKILKRIKNRIVGRIAGKTIGKINKKI
jgi:hypothetical protein